MSAWWSDDRIKYTVTREYINDRLPVGKQNNLHRPLAFGDGLTDDTYLDWILLRGQRLFLIFEDIRLPECIFEAIDSSLDDNDLPLSEEAVAGLNLPNVKTSCSAKAFHRRQFKYIVRELREGHHVDYGAEEIVPVDPLAKRSGILPSHNADKVSIGNSLYGRRKVVIGQDEGVDRVHFLLHLKSLMRLKHPHLITVFATYTQGLYGYVLSTPSLEVTLKSFLEDPPKHFRSLPKPEKRGLLLQWIHCLSNAIAYLHEQSHAHQAIRPSNIFINSQNHIYLGETAALDALEGNASSYDKENYDYASPELWQRKPVLQEINPSRTTLPGGGRTGRRLPKFKPDSDFPGSTSPSPTMAGAATNFVLSPSTVSGFSHNPRSSTATSICTAPSTAPTTQSFLTNSSSSSGTSTIRKRTLITTFAPASLPTLLPSDIFSLSAIHIQLLSALFSLASSSHLASKFSAKSLRHHLSKHNRSAGRGGAPADSSFHANLGQVGSWLDKLQKEARDKLKGGENEAIWEAVIKLAEVFRMGMIKDWNERWEARKGERWICSLVLRWGGCCGGNGQGPLPKVPHEGMIDGFIKEETVEGNENDGVLVFDSSSSVYSIEEEPRDGHARGDWILPEHFPVAPLQQKFQPTVRTESLQDRPNLSRIPTAQLRAELENRHAAQITSQSQYYNSDISEAADRKRVHPAYRSSNWPL